MKKTLFLATVLLLTSALGLAACGGGAAPTTPPPTATSAPPSTEEAPPASAGDPANGEKLFVSTCSACHGPAGEGIEGLGKDMTTSEFIAGQTDEELVEFIKVGRPADDPLNTTGVAMLPKGGNPALTDQDLLDIVSFIRTLQK